MWLILLACTSPDPDTFEVAEGSYVVVVPDGVDPSQAPALVHLHANGLGEQTSSRPAVQEALAEQGLVGIFPEGWGDDASTDWNVGNNRHDIPRDDVAFLVDVADDVVARFGPTSLWLGGSSKGGAMTYELGCLADDSAYDGFLPMAGAVEKELPGPCAHPPRPWRHLQGRNDDNHWPLWTADDPTSSHMGIMDSLLELEGTDASCLDAAAEEDGTGCQRWACAEAVELCWYEGGHGLPGDWVARQARAIAELAP